MIICNLHEADRYTAVVPFMDQVLDFLRSYNAEDFEEGEFDLGHRISVKAQANGLIPRERVLLESHARFIDVHVPLKSVETIGWTRRGDCSLVQKAYDEEADVAFYGDMAQCMLHVKPGQIAIFFPEDAHAPNIGIGTHRKLCIKIPVI